MPTTTGRSSGAAGEQARQEAERQVVDRLEAEVLERADRGRPPGARRPAHDHDVLPRLGLPASVTFTPCPTARPCLPQSGKARPFCTKMVNYAGQDLGRRGRKSIRCRRPRYVIVARCGIRAAGARSRSTASATGASGTAGSRRMPTPRASISPASGSGARGDQRAAAPDEHHAVVGHQRRARARSAAAPAPTCPRPRRRESGAPRPASATAEPCTIVESAAVAPPVSAAFPFGAMRTQPNTESQHLGTPRPRHFAVEAPR